MTLGTPESCHRARGCLPDTPEFYPDARKTLPDASKFESDARELSWDASGIRPGDREFCWGAPEHYSGAQKIRPSARKFCPDVPGFDSGAREIDSGQSGRMSLVSCLTNGWCFAARDSRVQRGASHDVGREWSCGPSRGTRDDGVHKQNCSQASPSSADIADPPQPLVTAAQEIGYAAHARGICTGEQVPAAHPPAGEIHVQAPKPSGLPELRPESGFLVRRLAHQGPIPHPIHALPRAGTRRTSSRPTW
jgi:hypothetical protein